VRNDLESQRIIIEGLAQLTRLVFGCPEVLSAPNA
jgi:hypothetical protein